MRVSNIGIHLRQPVFDGSVQTTGSCPIRIDNGFGAVCCIKLLMRANGVFAIRFEIRLGHDAYTSYGLKYEINHCYNVMVLTGGGGVWSCGVVVLWCCGFVELWSCGNQSHCERGTSDAIRLA